MPLPRLPTSSDFPSTLTLAIVLPNTDSVPSNVLLLLHGFGDTHRPFIGLSKNLNLHSTVCISLCAPSPVPAFITGSNVPSFHWGDDILFNERSDDIEMDAGFTKALDMLKAVLKALVEKCQFKERNLLLLGWGQGGMAALALAASTTLIEKELGGIVSIGGRLPASGSRGGSGSGKLKTPVLLCGGRRSTQITRSAVDSVRERFGEVEYVRWEKDDDSMPRNRDEMLPLMKFFARRLGSRAGVPDAAVEL